MRKRNLSPLTTRPGKTLPAFCWLRAEAAAILRAPNNEATAGCAGASFASLSVGGTSQPGAAPWVAVYTA
jgi:hypothetical protein